MNSLHNIVHLAVGALLLAGAARGFATARNANLLVGAVYAVVGLLGLFSIDKALDVIGLNHPDNGLHLVTAALLLAVALSYRPQTSRVGR